MSKEKADISNLSGNKPPSFLKKNSGFSLVELGIALIISGILIVPIYALMVYVVTLKPTDDRMAVIQEALAEHVRVTGTLPCPANLSLDIDSNTDAYRGQSTGDICTGSISNGNVYIGAVPIQNLKVVTDCASNDNSDVPLASDAVTALKDSVYSMAEIFTGKKFASGLHSESTKAENVRCPLNEYIMDEHGHKFIYAVSTKAVKSGFDAYTPLDNGYGVEVRDINNNIISENQPYILVDLGPDGKGGYDRHGTKNGGSCGTSDADSENCDYDDTFVASSENLASGSYYDDIVDYNIGGFLQENNFWNWTNNGGSTSNVALNQHVMLTIDLADPNNTASTLPALAADDGVVVNRGGILTQGDLTVHAQEHIASTAYNIIDGGNVTANEHLDATVNETNIKNISLSAQYCYSADLALTPECNASSGNSNCQVTGVDASGASCCADGNPMCCDEANPNDCSWDHCSTYGYLEDGTPCCADNDSMCCPASAYQTGSSSCPWNSECTTYGYSQDGGTCCADDDPLCCAEATASNYPSSCLSNDCTSTGHLLNGAACCVDDGDPLCCAEATESYYPSECLAGACQINGYRQDGTACCVDDENPICCAEATETAYPDSCQSDS